MIRVFRRSCALLIALLPLPASAEPRVVARAAGGPAPLVVYASDDGLAVEADGRVERLTTPAGLRLESAVRIAGGWLLAGARPTEAGSDLWLARDGRELAPPAGAVARLRMNPLPLVDGGALAGLAWLEGEGRRQLAVKFAPWRDGGFGPAVEIAPPGPGSQLALTGARLADGRLLLAWAGFDGEDDEIWAAWSTPDGRWTRPARIGGDNRVPEITPDLVAVGDGALVAWSRFDGAEYQLVVARFDGARFGPPRAIGEPGSTDGTFEPSSAGLALLYRDARRGSWALVELAADGAPGRVSRLEAGAAERPAVRWGARGPHWALGARTAATAWE
jgi:hypothetical protein